VTALLPPPTAPVGPDGRSVAGSAAGPGPGPAAGGKALVLNASMEPLCVVPSRRALVLVLTDKAELVHAGPTTYHSERLDVPCPSVVQLRRFVRVPYRRRATLTRRGVFIRDGHTCQYCGRPAENIDHVHPRSRHGAHDWENVVAACTRCNSRKGDRTLAEAGMTLVRRPFAPKAAFWMVVAVGRVRPEWECYLGDALHAA
jgi:5-methylcytosine-specific restriction endonuclease McrA